MRRPYYILQDRIPVAVKDVLEWGYYFETQDRKVKRDDIRGVIVSTVFLGLDHNHFSGPPLLFETMIFGGRHDQYQTRCSTWEQAEEQHAVAVKLVKSEFIKVING